MPVEKAKFSWAEFRPMKSTAHLKMRIFYFCVAERTQAQIFPAFDMMATFQYFQISDQPLFHCTLPTGNCFDVQLVHCIMAWRTDYCIVVPSRFTEIWTIFRWNGRWAIMIRLLPFTIIRIRLLRKKGGAITSYQKRQLDLWKKLF